MARKYELTADGRREIPLNETAAIRQLTDEVAGLRGQIARYESVQPIVDAAIDLGRELGGCFATFELSIRQEIGNTNYQLVADKLAALEAALEADEA